MEILKDYIEDCPEVFENLEVIYYASWQGYEESGKIVVFKFFDEIMMLNDGYCVMAENNEFVFDPQSITYEYLLELKEDWAEHLIFDVS